jgi:carboxypeptidase C (cathepsin A)
VSPFQIEDETTLSINKHSWHHHANILFIDQPVGTGMSLTRGNDLRKDEETVAKDFYTVLTQFFQRHPEYLSAKSASGIRTSRDLYMFGESHAGRFIPQFFDHIMTRNDLLANTKDGGIHISLQGVGIGNGWVHPFIQYDYSDYAHGLGLITFGQVRALKTAYAECQNALASGNFLTAACFENMNSILDGVRNTRASGGKSLNYYDAREYVRNVKAYPPQRTFIRDYMNQMQVRELLHANTDPSFRFKGCSDEVYDELRLFDGVSTLAEVERMLQSGVRVLFYNGQWDMMCNHYGTEKLLLHLDWNGSTFYQEAKKYMWTTPGRNEPAGFAQEGGNLSYVVIANAGHMVPLDVPDVAVEMVRRFINSERFDDAAQPVKSFATNRTNYETTQCLAGIPATPVGVKGNGVSLTWLWIAVVVAVVGSLLVCCVSMLCRRSRNKARHSEHSVVIQESDDEEEEDEERMEKEDGESDEELTEVAIRSRG